MYAIQGEINGQTGFVVAPYSKSDPSHVQCSNDIFQATLFKHHVDAANALDGLKHGIAKCCRIVGVRIHEMVEAADSRLAQATFPADRRNSG